MTVVVTLCNIVIVLIVLIPVLLILWNGVQQSQRVQNRLRQFKDMAESADNKAALEFVKNSLQVYSANSFFHTSHQEHADVIMAYIEGRLKGIPND